MSYTSKYSKEVTIASDKSGKVRSYIGAYVSSTDTITTITFDGHIQTKNVTTQYSWSGQLRCNGSDRKTIEDQKTGTDGNSNWKYIWAPGSFTSKFNRKASKYVVTISCIATINSQTATAVLDITIPAATTYKITYDANGGSGAPEATTKYAGRTLTLSTSKPQRNGYTFLGWSTSKTATTAKYTAGGSYSANAAATLYAVWKASTSGGSTWSSSSMWDNPTLEHYFTVQMVDPNNLSTVRGELSGVEATGSLSLQYDSDTRASASITTAVKQGSSDGWDGTAALRIIHHVGSNYKETLFTGFVTACPWSESNGKHEVSYTLSSTLYGMSTHRLVYAYTIAKKGSGVEALKKLFEYGYRKYTLNNGVLDYTYTSAQVYSGDKDFLEVAHDIADTCNDRIDVAPSGYVTLSKYVAPASRSPKYYFSIYDSDSPFYGDISGDDDKSEIPGRIVVSAKDSDNELIAEAEVSSTSIYSPSRRGYKVDSYYSIDLDDDTTQAYVNSLAKQYLEASRTPTYTMDVNMLYRPLTAGDILRITKNSTTHNYLITTANLDLHYFTWSLELEQVS